VLAVFGFTVFLTYAAFPPISTQPRCGCRCHSVGRGS
jgi:hypothetical protein